MRVALVLENGSVFYGDSIGETSEQVFELVFNTATVGYQEILTDPAYAGQGVVMTYPLIGNYGVNGEDDQSRQPWVKALVVRHLIERGSNFRREGDLAAYLTEHHIAGIQNVDTRALTRILRSQGTMNAMIADAGSFSVEACVEKLKSHKSAGLVDRVTRPVQVNCPARGEKECRLAVLDLGATDGLLDAMAERGCELEVFPARTAVETLLDGSFDGVVVTGGPGDPHDEPELVETMKKLFASDKPLLALGLGHELLALANGAEVRKMRFGHRGCNQPVKDLDTGRVFITAQNHGYCVEAQSVPAEVGRVSHINVNDGVAEGLRYQRPGCISLQFDPEISRDPVFTGYLFEEFLAAAKKGGVQ